MEDHIKLSSPPPELLQRASLFLDFDGTLVEIAARPDTVYIEPRLHGLMRALNESLGGRLAVVSGRPAREILALFGKPAFVVAGSHGLELIRPDEASPRELSVPLQMPSEAFADLQLRFPGVIVEFKPFGVALHYRLAPDAERMCHDCARDLALRYGLQVQSGKMVVELRAPGADKGDAVAELMKEPPMNAGVPLFIGDDETDEAGFAMANVLGGVGILVGPRRQTHAKYQIETVEGTLRWLAQACGAAI